jgi:opacity protein-like surface antigen
MISWRPQRLASAMVLLTVGSCLSGAVLLGLRKRPTMLIRFRNIAPFFPATALSVDPSGTMTKTGWTAGTGLAWAFAPRWSARLEYNYYDFGNNAFTLTDNATGARLTGSLKVRIHTVTTGVDYHF